MEEGEKLIHQYITVSLLGSGYAALHMGWFRDKDGNEYPDCINTGIGRYKDRKKAEIEARSWSKSDEIPLEL
jgi:hypothetical protein